MTFRRWRQCVWDHRCWWLFNFFRENNVFLIMQTCFNTIWDNWILFKKFRSCVVHHHIIFTRFPLDERFVFDLLRIHFKFGKKNSIRSTKIIRHRWSLLSDVIQRNCITSNSLYWLRIAEFWQLKLHSCFFFTSPIFL